MTRKIKFIKQMGNGRKNIYKCTIYECRWMAEQQDYCEESAVMPMCATVVQ